MRPAEVPAFRAGVLEHFDRVAAELAEGERLIADVRAHPMRVAPGSLARLEEAQRSQAGLRDLTCGPAWTRGHWRMADLFHVTAEMAAVATAAAETMPAFELQADDLPSPSGVLVFDVGSVSLTTAGRSDLEGMDVVAVWGPDHSGAGGNVALTICSRHPRDGRELLVLHVSSLRWGVDPLLAAIQGGEHVEAWARIVRCTWLLMQQRVAVSDVVLPDRASARRLARAGRPVDPVRVIRLRSAAGVAPAEGESARAYAHRWVVRGHWRKQWYASQGRHVPIWISPFVKGPEGAPLLGGEKVYSWSR